MPLPGSERSVACAADGMIIELARPMSIRTPKLVNLTKSAREARNPVQHANFSLTSASQNLKSRLIMKPSERRRQLLEYVLERGTGTVHDLVERFQCSGGTIRNDLRALEQEGKLIRTFSGAKSPLGPQRDARLTAGDGDYEQARAIAQRAAGLVRDGDTVLIYPDRLTELMADDLLGMKSLTVITNSLSIAQRLSHNPNHTIILIGGHFRFGQESLSGASGVAMLQSLRANMAFIPCDGISGAQGFATNDIAAVQIKTAMVDCAQTVVMLALPEVFGSASVVSFASLNQAHHCITTTDAPPDPVSLLRSAGVRVSLCGERMTEVCAHCPPNRPWRIGFANLHEGSDFASTIRRSIEHAAQAHGGFELILVNNASDPQTALDNARRLIAAKVDLAIEYQLHERTNHAIMDLFRQADIPVIAVDIPMPGAVFFGADNYRAGQIAGEAAVSWIRRHWAGCLDRVVCFQQSIVGPLPAGRIHGELDALRMGLGISDADIMFFDTNVLPGDAQRAATQALRNIPWGKKVLFVGIDGGAALAGLAAAEALDRQAHTAVACQNVDAKIRAELRRGNPMLIGAVDYFPERYGDHIIRIASDLLSGRPVPPAIYTEHRLLTADDVTSPALAVA